MYSQIISNEAERSGVLTKIRALDITKKHIVVIKRYRKSRTVNQNKLLWMWYNLIADELGYKSEDIHEYYKAQFLTTINIEILGRSCFVPKSTTDLTTEEFGNYLEKIHNHALQINIYCPWPETDGWDQFSLQYYERA